MARIPALEPPFTPDVEAQLATMMPAGVPAALHDASDVDDELWRSAQELLDVLLLCGWYHTICFAARTARVDLEPGAPRFADITAA